MPSKTLEYFYNISQNNFAEGKYSDINFVPPESVRKAAKRGLELRKKSKRGGLTTSEAGKQGIGSGVARAATLASGKAISPNTARRMKAFFDRHSAFKKNHEIDSKTGKGSASLVSWLLWGGDAGYSWAKKLVNQMNARDEKSS